MVDSGGICVDVMCSMLPVYCAACSHDTDSARVLCFAIPLGDRTIIPTYNNVGYVEAKVCRDY